MPSRTTRSEKLNPRITREDRAFASVGETLADRRAFGLNALQWKAFLAALDAPPRPLPRLERLMKEPGFFDA